MKNHAPPSRLVTGLAVACLLVVACRAQPVTAGPEDTDAVARLDSLLAAGLPDEAAAEADRYLDGSALPARLRGPVIQRRCVALQAAGRLLDALPVCEEAVLEMPADPVNHQNLGTCLQNLGQLGRAAGELGQALELAPEQIDWRLQYARVMLDLGARRESLRQIETAAQACRDCPKVDRALADHALRTDRPEKAIAPLQRLMIRAPTPQIRELLVQACWGAGRLAALDSTLMGAPLPSLSPLEIQLWLQADRQRQFVTRARQFAPGGADFTRIPGGARVDPRFWALVAELCLLGDDATAALAAIDSAIVLAPQDGRWHRNRAAALARLGREREAVDALARARALGLTGP